MFDEDEEAKAVIVLSRVIAEAIPPFTFVKIAVPALGLTYVRAAVTAGFRREQIIGFIDHCITQMIDHDKSSVN